MFEKYIEVITEVNDKINGFVWVTVGLWLLIATGLIMSCVTGFFQVTHFGHWMKKTIGSVFGKSAHNKKEAGSVSQFQALCTALAATIGTGNIAGVAAAIVIGGPGAVFWMWVAAFLGMMTNYSENILGIFTAAKTRKENGQAVPCIICRTASAAKTGRSSFVSPAVFWLPCLRFAHSWRHSESATWVR